MAAGLLACAFSIAATPALLQATGLESATWARNLETGYPLGAPLQRVLVLVALAGAWRWFRASRRTTP
jgi:hypothetical protein